MSGTRFLNLDDIETVESDITIRHEGADYKMRTLSVDMFITQQKRAAEHQKALEAEAQSEDVDMGSIVELIRDAILEFFPTLPVGGIPTPKLFAIFAWLNEMSEKVNEIASADVIDASAEGNVPEQETATA